MRKPGLLRKAPAGAIELAASQGLDQIAAKPHSVAVPLGKSVLCQHINSLFQGCPDLCAETGARELSRFARHKLPVEPCGAFRARFAAS